MPVDEPWGATAISTADRRMLDRDRRTRGASRTGCSAARAVSKRQPMPGVRADWADVDAAVLSLAPATTPV